MTAVVKAIPGRVALALARARLESGLTQAEVARRMGTTQSAVARAESGRAGVSLDFIDRFARVVGRPILIEFGGLSPLSLGERVERRRRALGDFAFDPWTRNPSPTEVKVLRREAIGATKRSGRSAAAGRTG